MHKLIRTKAYEADHGPHFDEECAHKAVSKMHNEDGTRGAHWTLEETTLMANQYGVHLDRRINKYDWFVALNMVYSDFYKAILTITGSNSTKHFVELTKAWINDKDIDEGKMWYYYIYVMCDKIRDEEDEYYEEHEDEHDDEDYGRMRVSNYRRMGRSSYGRYRDLDRDYDDYDTDYEHKRFPVEDESRRPRSIRYIRY